MEQRNLEKDSISRTIYAVTLGIFLVLFFSGCSKPSISVPIDCQNFLDKWFEAVKLKDIEKIQEYSSYIKLVESEKMPEESVKTMREFKRKLATETFQRMINMCGDFKSYYVLSIKVKTIASGTVEANMLGAGIHTEIVCIAKFSKIRSVRIGLHLFKETQESAYSVLAWKCQAEL